jgi:peptidoglycan hydrolase-like protein with peptidoglycan-binding domain
MKRILGSVFAIAFAFSVVATPVQGATTAELEALIAQLQAQLAALAGGTTPQGPAVQFNMDLTIGSTGADVTALQQNLVANGYLQMPAGVAYGYFGTLTQSAVARWQAAVGIAPAVGYFGPISRARMNATVVTTPGTPGTPGTSGLSGGAGDIESVEFISSLNNEEVGEDEEDVEVAGWDIEATDGSDIELLAVTLDFDKVSNGAGSDDDLEDYADEVSVWFNGEEVARMDADAFDDDNNFRRSVTLDSGAVIDMEDTGELVVALTGVSNLDSANEEEEWNVSLTSIRFADAQGAIITYSDGADMENPIDNDTTTDSDERQFSFESFATAADVELVVSDGNDDINESRLIQVDDNDDTDGVELFSFELEAEGDSDIEVKDLLIYFTAAGAGAPTVNEIISSAELFIDGDSVGTENITISTVAGTTTFDGIDYVIRAGDTVEVVLEVDVNNLDGASFQDGNTLMAEIRSFERDAIDAEDEEGNDLSTSELSGTASSDAHTFSLTGVMLSGVESNVNTLANDDSTGSISWEFTLDAEDGDLDFNIANKVDVDGSSDDTRFTLSGTDTSIGTTTITLVSGDATSDGSGWVIEDGDDATFILETTFSTLNAGDNGTYRVRLDSVAGIEVDEISQGLLLADN